MLSYIQVIKGANLGVVLYCINYIKCFLCISYNAVWDKKNKPYLLTLAMLNVLLIFYHFFTLQFHTALSLKDGIFHNQYQTTFVLLALPLLAFTFGQWSQYKFTNALVIIYTIIIIPLLGINFTGEGSLRFGSNAVLIQYQSIFGDDVSLLKGSATYFTWLPLLVLTSVLLNSFFSYRLYRQQKSIISLTIIVYLFFQIIVAYAGYKIDKLEWSIFYLGGLPLTIFSVICTMLISTSFRNVKKRLTKNINQKKSIEQAMRNLAEATSDLENNTFYNKTVINIQQLFKTKFVFIGLYKKNNISAEIETLAVVNNGKIIENFTYQLKGTPCNEVVGKKVCYYENDVELLYPNDFLLTEMGIKAYIGLPIFSRDKKPLGIIILLHNTKYKLDNNLLPFLHVFGERVGSELSRDALDKKLKYIAYIDYMTKLPNRASLFDKISSTSHYNTNRKTNSLLILIDIDYFKEINTVYGYDIADDILKEVSHRLRVYIGKNSFIARNNGDEFAILINQYESDIESLINIHWEAISAVIKAPIYLNNQSIKIKCSAGVVIFPLQANDRYSVIRNAESALQQAKYNGRNQYAVFDENVQATIERKKIILKCLSEAIQVDNQLFMVYQPQTDNNGNLLGVEALIRWNSPELGFISPGEFIPIVEPTELIHELGYWIIENVLSQLQTWIRSGVTVPAHVSINVASKQLIHVDFVNKLIEYCQKFEIKPSQIILELTESGILTDRLFAVKCLKKLRHCGFRIALDDFGTGYSSLSYLKDLPIDIIKIDKSFIDEIHLLSTRQLIQSIFSIGEYLDLAIVAEGAEHKEQIDELVSLGCKLFQGYYFGKPLKPQELINRQTS